MSNRKRHEIKRKKHREKLKKYRKIIRVKARRSQRKNAELEKKLDLVGPPEVLEPIDVLGEADRI